MLCDRQAEDLLTFQPLRRVITTELSRQINGGPRITKPRHVVKSSVNDRQCAPSLRKVVNVLVKEALP